MRALTTPKALPKTPRLSTALKEPPTGLPQEQKAPEDQNPASKLEAPNFLANYSEWRGQHPQGSVMEYLVWSYLTDTKQWQNHYQFEYKWKLLGGQATADFYIHYDRLVWQIKSGLYGRTRDDALATAQEALLRKERYRVVDIYPDDLIYRSEYTLGQALEGQSATVAHATPGGVKYVAN